MTTTERERLLTLALNLLERACDLLGELDKKHEAEMFLSPYVSIPHRDWSGHSPIPPQTTTTITPINTCVTWVNQ